MKHRLVDGAQGTVTRKLMGAAGMIPDFHQPAVQAAQVEKTVAKKADNDADEWTDAEKDAAWRKHMARGDYADSHVLDRVVPSDYNGDKTAQHTSPSSKVASPDRHHTSTPPSIDKPLIDEALKTKLLAELVDELYALPESVLPRKYKQAVSFALQDSYLCQKKENELDISPEKLAVNKSIERPPNGGIPSFLKPVEMALRKPLVAREINGRVVFVDDDSESDNAQRHTLSWDSFGDDSDLEVSPTFKFDQHPRHTIGHNNPIASPNFRFRSSPQLDNHSIHPNYLPALSIAHTEDKMGCSAEKPARLEGKDSRVKLVLEPKSALKVSQVPRNAAERKMATSFGIPTGDTSLAKKASDFDSSNKLSRAVEAPPAHNDAAMAKLLRSPHAPVRGTSLEREDANLRSVKKHPFAAGTSLPGSTADKMTTSSGITDRGTSLEKASDLDSENKLSCAATTGVGNAASMSGHYDTEEVDAPFEMDAGWRRMFMGDALITRMLDVQPDIAMFWENYSIVEMNAL